MVETRAVIDTAPLIAYLGGAQRALGRAARRLCERARAGHVRLAVPTACLFEVGLLEERGRIRLGVPFERWCDLVEAAAALLLLAARRSRVSKPPALRRPPPSAGLRRTGPADVFVNHP